jgi:uncharacterized protein YaaN involved in tellurite resistance
MTTEAPTTTTQPENAMPTVEAMLADVAGETTNLPTVAADKDQAAVDSMLGKIVSITDLASDETAQLAQQIENFGIQAQRRSGNSSQMLKQSIGKLDPTGEGSNSGNVGNLLMDLNNQCTELDPSGVDMSKPWWANLQVMLPFLKTPLQKYFMKYQSADSVLKNIETGLLKGQDMLRNDNIILNKDQKKMREAAQALQQAINAGTDMQTKLNEAIDNGQFESVEVTNFVKEHMLFPLNQRIIDLQQQLAVNQQGIMSSAVIIRTNKDLIKGVDRALSVTMSAIEIAVSLSLALANQEIVLKQLDVLNKTTGNMIEGIGKKLNQNAAKAQEQAASANLDMQQLKNAMEETRQAIDSVMQYRINAVDHMNNDIAELNTVLEENSATIEKMDKGQEVADFFESVVSVQ